MTEDGNTPSNRKRNSLYEIMDAQFAIAFVDLKMEVLMDVQHTCCKTHNVI